MTSIEHRGPGPGYAGDGAGDGAPPGQAITEPAEAALVLEIWQELVGATLSPDSVRRFRAHPDFMVLGHYDRRRLEVAGRQLYGRTGRLLLAEWARECAWAGGGSLNLSWAELAAGDSGAGVVARDLVAAVVGSLPSQRDRAVLTQRLALDGDAPLALRSIGERMGITGERVRQLQNRALDRMCRRGAPPGVRQYARQAIAAVLNQAESASAETGESLLTLAEAALPVVPAALAVQVLAQLAGHSRQASKHVAAEAITLRAVRDAELAREVCQAEFAQRAAALLTRLSAGTEWPDGRKPAPPQSLIIPQRGHDAETLESVKLGRKVAFESKTELSLIRALTWPRRWSGSANSRWQSVTSSPGGTAPTIPTCWRPPRKGTASSSKLSLCSTCHWRSTRRKLPPRELSVLAAAGGSWSQTFAGALTTS